MPIGPGKYDDIATRARKDTGALGVILMISGGAHGSGFSVQGPLTFLLKLPQVLREMADDIEADARRQKSAS